eukprot:2472374-Pleurochrysis_carterae.AAC.1
MVYVARCTQLVAKDRLFSLLGESHRFLRKGLLWPLLSRKSEIRICRDGAVEVEQHGGSLSPECPLRG